ncbi:MAG TPA: D-sedoheptulose 7-phosphate isomerase [Candidatus Acidoferrum sp.]|jgi:D-sedoheptulose 7-phosphate isomerase
MAATAGTEGAVQENIETSMAVQRAMLNDAELLAGIAKAAELIVEALLSGRRLLLMGNGGSAADAQHIAAEFVGRYRLERRAMPAMALTVNTSTLTAIGNDYGFEEVFARQVEAFAQPGDVLLALSTSGNSRNLLRGAVMADALRVKTIALTGQSGGKLRSAVNLCLRVPSSDTPRIQEAHILLGHTISEMVEAELFRR